MHIERIHEMIECLTEKALCELQSGIENVDTCEFEKVVDMIKDLNEAEYRAVITKSMKKADKEEEEYNKELLKTLKMEYGEEGGRRYYDHYRYSNGRFAPKGSGTYRRNYDEPPYWHMTPEMYRDMDKDNGRMYYTEPMNEDKLMGKSGTFRKTYMESKELHKNNSVEDKEAKMKDLENYMKGLSDDVMEMVDDMTTEEKTMLKQKIMTLSHKLQEI